MHARTASGYGLLVALFLAAPGRAETQREEPGPSTWLGVGAGLDFVSVPGVGNVCAPTNHHCYASNDREVAGPETATDVGFSGGIRPASPRLLVTLSHFFGSHFHADVRVGGAFDPLPIRYFPLHAELRVGHLFGPARAGVLRGHVFAGGGLARTSTKLMNFVGADTGGPAPHAEVVDAFATYGPYFVSGGAGLFYSFTENLALDGQVAAVGYFGDAGVGVQPWVGVVARF